jgi:hypothetical protein
LVTESSKSVSASILEKRPVQGQGFSGMKKHLAKRELKREKALLKKFKEENKRLPECNERLG